MFKHYKRHHFPIHSPIIFYSLTKFTNKVMNLISSLLILAVMVGVSSAQVVAPSACIAAFQRDARGAYYLDKAGVRIRCIEPAPVTRPPRTGGCPCVCKDAYHAVRDCQSKPNCWTNGKWNCPSGQDMCCCWFGKRGIVTWMRLEAWCFGRMVWSLSVLHNCQLHGIVYIGDWMFHLLGFCIWNEAGFPFLVSGRPCLIEKKVKCNQVSSTMLNIEWLSCHRTAVMYAFSIAMKSGSFWEISILILIEYIRVLWWAAYFECTICIGIFIC